MDNYIESKKQLNKIRAKYACKGNVLFRTSIQYIVEYGQQFFRDSKWVQEQLNEIDARHDEAERNGKHLWTGRAFEKALIECAAELAAIETYDLLVYIQREVYLGGNGISYQRVLNIIKNCLDWICDDSEDLSSAYEKITNEINIDDYELEELGFGHLFDLELKGDEFE